MPLPWALFVAALPLLALASDAEICTAHSTSTNYTSPILESLQCINDYKSHIRCSWIESGERPAEARLSLYHWDDRQKESLCVPYGQPVKQADGRLVHCRYNTTVFALAIIDTFFFKTPCPPPFYKKLNLSEHVRVRPPQNLSERAVEGGGRVLTWQNPYPPQSNCTEINYQVNYRRLGQDWMEKTTSGLELKIEAESLVPGCRYQARVRARKEKGLWSEWSPLVEWQTENAPVSGPSNLQCVFDGETEVSCSWEVKRDLAQFITYNLSYVTDKNRQSQWCSKVVSSPTSDDPVLRFSCSFSVSSSWAEPEVKLVPAYNTKVILARDHVEPSPPDGVQVKEKGQDWLLTWTTSSKEEIVPVFYQVCYWSDDNQENVKFHNLSKGERSFVIHGSALLPSTRYKAQVRTLIAPDSGYNHHSGPPSECTPQVEWNTPPASWSMTTIIYIFISVLVAIVFIGLYIALPACHRRIVLWQVSVPSPLKSKVLEEIMKRSPNSRPTLQKEDEKTRICSVQVLDKDQLQCFSEDCCHPMGLTIVSDNGPFQCMAKQGRDAAFQPEGLDHSDSLCVAQAKESCLSFSGPYIFCSTCSLTQCGKADGHIEDNPFGSSSSFSQVISPSPSQINAAYVELPESPCGLSEASARMSSQERDTRQNGYVGDPRSVKGDPRPEPVTELPDCDPPAYTAGPLPIPTVLLQGAPESGLLPDPEAVDWDTAYPSTTTVMLKGKGGGGGERREVSDYVRLSEPFCTP
ncbi:cytokine receptor common subunit beta [Megalops cyprinoides]|uniref:cytokine receptor common subunit beta n=1 Tax=Megalops cyprinoides TaxID=118141 RepID=UPI0018643F00|nr:cytokine receptor common subunit beta [Megalops cyprinoides]